MAQPGNPGKKWRTFLGCLIVVFVLLGTYDIICGKVGIRPGDALSIGHDLMQAATHTRQWR